MDGRSSGHSPFAFDAFSAELKGRSGLVARSAPEVSEVCVKTAAHGWVVGRRATQTHREFFVLLDEKVGPLSEVQGTARRLSLSLPPHLHAQAVWCVLCCADEVERLARTYFYNIFSH